MSSRCSRPSIQSLTSSRIRARMSSAVRKALVLTSSLSSSYRPERALTMLFIDGLGIGSENPRENPMARFNPRVLGIFESSAGPVMAEGRILPTDVRMGVAGTPQSATNQTTLFTGTNAAQRLGRHVSGFPNASLKELIRQRSLMRRLHSQGYKVRTRSLLSSGGRSASKYGAGTRFRSLKSAL